MAETATPSTPSTPSTAATPAQATGSASAGRARRILVAAAVVAWLAAGAPGLWRYVDGYVIYRGFPPPVTPAGVSAGRVEKLRFFSPALHQQSTALVYVPPG